MSYWNRGAAPDIERRGHAARIINTNKVVLDDHHYSGRSWMYARSRRVPSSTIEALPTKDQKALLAGARTKRERRAFAAVMR